MLFGGNAGIEEVVPTAADISKLPRIDLITKKLLLLPGYTPALKDDMADVDEASVSELTLNHKENSLNIEFFGLNYDKSSNIEYAYMLEGLDKTLYIRAHTTMPHTLISHPATTTSTYEPDTKANNGKSPKNYSVSPSSPIRGSRQRQILSMPF